MAAFGAVLKKLAHTNKNAVVQDDPQRWVLAAPAAPRMSTRLGGAEAN